MATQNRRGYGNPGGSADLGSGIRTTTGGSYRNPRLGIKDTTAFSRGFASTFRTPEIQEKEELKFKELNTFGDELDPFSTTDDGKSWNLNREFGVLLNNNFKQGELAMLGKNFEKGDKNIQNRIQGHLSGYHAAFGVEDSTFGNYISKYTDAQVYDHNISTKWLPNENGINSGLTYAQLAKDSNVNPNDWEYHSKPNKNGIMHYGMRKKSTGQFFSASALTPEWLEENFNVKANLSGDVQISILKDGTAQGYKAVKPTYNEDKTSVTINLPDGSTVETDKNSKKYIRQDWYNDTDNFATIFAGQKYGSKYDATYKSAWYQLGQKFENGSFIPSDNLMTHLKSEYGINDISELSGIDITNEDRIRLLQDEAKEEFKILNGSVGYDRGEDGRALDKRVVQYNTDNIIKPRTGDESDSGIASGFISNISNLITDVIGVGTAGTAPAGWQKKQIDNQKAMEMLERVEKRDKVSYLNLQDEASVSRWIKAVSKEIDEDYTREDLYNSLTTKKPSSQHHHIVQIDWSGTALEASPVDFDGTIGSLSGDFARAYGLTGNKKEVFHNQINKLIGEFGGDIDKYNSWAKGLSPEQQKNYSPIIK